MHRFKFPVGYHDFHKVKIIDFQLNRWYSLDTRLEDTIEVAGKIHKLEDWKVEMVKLGDIALSEERFMNAAFYYRGAEFFTMPSAPDKEKLYDRFINLFYNKVFAEEPIEKFSVPYENTFLPAIKINSQKKKIKEL